MLLSGADRQDQDRALVQPLRDVRRPEGVEGARRRAHGRTLLRPATCDGGRARLSVAPSSPSVANQAAHGRRHPTAHAACEVAHPRPRRCRAVPPTPAPAVAPCPRPPRTWTAARDHPRPRGALDARLLLHPLGPPEHLDPGVGAAGVGTPGGSTLPPIQRRRRPRPRRPPRCRPPAPARPGRSCAQPTVEAPSIVEASGLAGGRINPGVWWTHNDSGDIPRVFALEGDGRLLTTVERPRRGGLGLGGHRRRPGAGRAAVPLGGGPRRQRQGAPAHDRLPALPLPRAEPGRPGPRGAHGRGRAHQHRLPGRAAQRRGHPRRPTHRRLHHHHEGDDGDRVPHPGGQPGERRHRHTRDRGHARPRRPGERQRPAGRRRHQRRRAR